MRGDALTPALLEERGLFVFTWEAREELKAFFADARVAETRGPWLAELVHLTAAELALAPAIIESRSVLPVTEPFTVDLRASQLALLKSNCAVITWHSARIRETEVLTLADITAFSGDASKLELLGLDFYEPSGEIGDIARAVDDLERLHRADPSDAAEALGSSGVLRLQGFLWAVKLSLPRQDLRQAIADAYEAFELSQPAGGSAVEPEPVVTQ